MKKNDLKKILVSIPGYLKYYGVIGGSKLTIKFFANNVKRISLKDVKSKIYLRKNTSDAATFHQIFAQREYGLSMLNIKPKVIIDGGANIGLFTVFIKNKFPDAKVIAIEPDRDNFHILEKNTADYDNIELINGGLWNKTTLLKVYDKYNYGKWGMVVEETTDISDSSAVESYSIDSIISKYGVEQIDLLKIDIETAEKYLFDKNCGTWLRKVRAIAIELHDWIEPGCAQAFFSSINQVFERYSYYIKGEITIVVNENL